MGKAHKNCIIQVRNCEKNEVYCRRPYGTNLSSTTYCEIPPSVNVRRQFTWGEVKNVNALARVGKRFAACVFIPTQINYGGMNSVTPSVPVLYPVLLTSTIEVVVFRIMP